MPELRIPWMMGVVDDADSMKMKFYDCFRSKNNGKTRRKDAENIWGTRADGISLEQIENVLEDGSVPVCYSFSSSSSSFLEWKDVV